MLLYNDRGLGFDTKNANLLYLDGVNLALIRENETFTTTLLTSQIFIRKNKIMKLMEGQADALIYRLIHEDAPYKY